jgi:hypothetical protein
MLTDNDGGSALTILVSLIGFDIVRRVKENFYDLFKIGIHRIYILMTERAIHVLQIVSPFGIRVSIVFQK